MLSEKLVRLAKSYVYERGKPFAGSAFGAFVRHDLAKEAKKALIFSPFDLTVKASVGAGNWAAVPWLAFYDPLITESATRGFYVVYLINPQTEEITISMNQGTTAVYQEFGISRGREVLRRRARDIFDRVSDYVGDFSDRPIDLGSNDNLPLGYVAGHAFGRTYKADELTDELLSKDLEKMLYAYEALINRGGTTPTDTMLEESGIADIKETRRYLLSRRIERSPKVRKAVLERRTPVCEGCDLDPFVDYAYNGPILKVPLDVHHIAPLRSLSEGESRRYKVPDDFLVLCPTCHRVIHSEGHGGDLQSLKNAIKFTRKHV
ncbi:MrcB family domain-containing protein [Marinovum sp.]|uniref:MrcB family domain-containing protein n=1 Tax=Marinovum sp. TaxID=2024839 RepID=UPI002B2777B0|nr:DUF3578 domain-containing protein [Marinovum sp.]